MRVQFGNFFGNTEYPESPRACLASISLSFPKYARACWLIKLAWYQHHYTLIPDKKKKKDRDEEKNRDQVDHGNELEDGEGNPDAI